MNSFFDVGKFHLAYGPMKSEKSKLIVKMIQRINLSNKLGQSISYQLFKPSVDTRDGPFIVSRGIEGTVTKYPATFISNDKPSDLLSLIKKDTKVIGVDEMQFFSNTMVYVVQELLKEGYLVVGAGLDLDFKRLPFGAMPQLINLATNPHYCTAVCDICGGVAQLTQRLEPDGKTPSSFNEDSLAIQQESCDGNQLVKVKDYIYQARCYKDYEMWDGPFKTI